MKSPREMVTEVCQQQEERAPQWPEEKVLQQYSAVYSIPLGYTVSALAKRMRFLEFEIWCSPIICNGLSSTNSGFVFMCCLM